MPSKPLKRVSIDHLRGASRPFILEFEKAKKLTLIYGENGTGKTTVCDALDFLGNGRIGSLDGRGLGKHTKYWTSLGKKPAAVSVILENSARSWRASLQKGVVVYDPVGERPHVEVLRRPQIQSLVADTEAARYEAIQRFIDVAVIEDAESEIRDSIKQQSARLGDAASEILVLDEQLANLWRQSGSAGADMLSWAAAQTEKDASLYTQDISDLEELRTAFFVLQDAGSRASEANRRHNEALAANSLAQNALTSINNEAAPYAELLVALLADARSYLSADRDPETCPVCESDAAIAGLLSRVDNRLETLGDLRKATQAVATASRALNDASDRQLEEASQVATRATEFNLQLARRAWPTELTLPASPAPTSVSALVEWLPDATTASASWPAVQAQWERASALLTSVSTTYARRIEVQEEQRELGRVLPKLQQTLDLLAEERKKFTDEILTEIAAEVGRLYEAVHPNEGLSKITLALDPKKRASLGIGTSFGSEQNHPPQAYLSDSHLDTLGLCVFLALAARENPADTILVLDDVLGSIDEPHVDRLIEMLYDETSRFQHCVITTHYRPWKKKFGWGWLPNGECQFIELTKWTLADGIRIIGTVPEIARLRALLADPAADAQMVASKAGVVLEAVLDFLTLQYQCAVPRKPDGLFTLGDLLPNIDKKLKKALKIEVKAIDESGQVTFSSHFLEPFLDELSRIAQVRNVLGAHFNKLSFELLDSDAINFGTNVLKLAELVIDEERGWPRSDKSGSYWETSGDTRRMHPLKRPK